MKILIVPDSFKGSLTSEEVCSCIESGIKKYDEAAEITSLPFADGGEGFSRILANICKADMLYTWCSDLYDRRMKASYYAYGDTAIIECATASGIQKKKDVMNATSYGTGELIKDAVQRGFRHIILGLGGSGCCDGGAGALAALGVVFRDPEGEIIDCPKGKDLVNIYGAGFTKRVKDIDFTYACDVENEFYGKNGAAYVFAPQKGASKEQVITLDEGLKMLNAFLPKDVGRVKGSGAAGGICGGLYSVYGGEIKSGFDILAEAYKLEEKISQADIVITGEGKTDEQTAMGKLPYKISQLCRKYGKTSVLISGSIDDVRICDKQISLVDESTSVEDCIANAKEILTEKSKFILQ